MRIILTGGGTGGHIFPLIAVERKLRILAHERGIENITFLYIGPRFDATSEEVFRREGIEWQYILSSKWRRYMSGLNILDILKFPFALLQALWVMFWNMPDAVFSKGGYGSFPVMFASWIFMIPSRVIHESDSTPGVANMMAAIFAKRIGTAFKSAVMGFPVEKTGVVGLPVRDDLGTQDPKNARQFFDITSSRKIILIMGGSQGARIINETIGGILSDLLNSYEIIHIAGPSQIDTFKSEIQPVLKGPKAGYYHLYPFLTEEIKFAYTLADLVISRAGASSIFEIASCNKPSILIPLKGSAQDHQRKNAYEYAKTGATILIEEDNLTPHLLLSAISSILEDKETFNKMATGASMFIVKDSAELIAKEILELRGVL